MVSLKKVFLYLYRVLSSKGFSFLLPKKYLIYFLFGYFVHERGVTKIMKDVSKNFDIFVDVGAFYGYFTLISKTKRKIAIEPNPENFEILKTNIKGNNIDVELVNKAISEKNGFSTLYCSQNRRRHSLKEEHVLDEIIDKIEVETTTLNKLLQGCEKEAILFKIDVEGHEPYVFQGMSNLLENKKTIIIFEYNPHKYNHEEKQAVVNFSKQFSSYLIDDETGSLEFLGEEGLAIIEKQHNILLSKEITEV